MRDLTASTLGLFRILLIVLLANLILNWCGPCPRHYDKLARGKAQIAMIQIKELESALQLFRFDVGRYLTTGEGLGALVRNHGNLKQWRGPYLQKSEIPRDPWGRPYAYQCPGKHGDCDLFSYGADGVEGGSGENADITNWPAAKARP